MDEIAAPDSGPKLSPTLLKYAAQGQPFLGFISYRRRDALPLARWLRNRIVGFQPPAELRQKIEERDRAVGGRQNRVFLDLSYQRPNVDFWDEHIGASLLRSQTMLLLQTPSVFEPLPGGEPNWVDREIEIFLEHFKDPSRILVVMGPGAPIDRFPSGLERISSRWDWIDLRFFSESPLQRFRHGAQYDAQIAKVLAKIYDIEDGELPILNREFARARAKVRRNIAAAGVGVIVALSGLSTWALIERSRAIAAEQRAIEQRDEAIRQRNAALISQSHFLAQAADGVAAEGTTRAAIALLRVALPDPAAGNDRPLVNDAMSSAYGAIARNLELGRIDMPQGATAVATDEGGRSIVIATGDSIVVRNGLTTEGERVLRHQFGPPARLALAANGRLLAMVAGDGTVAVRDLAADREIFRHAGEGAGTRVFFLNDGTRLLVIGRDQRKLHLLDNATGAELATRRFAPAAGQPFGATVDAKHGIVTMLAEGRLHRLSTEDLGDTATFEIGTALQVASTPAADGKLIYVAVAKALLDGQILVLDGETLALQRTFGKVDTGAQHVAISPNSKFLAVHGLTGIDFYDVPAGERLYKLVADTNADAADGRFLGHASDSDYMAFGPSGRIRSYVPELGTVKASYKTVDGGAIERIEGLPDRTGFLTISDRPSVTHWAFDAQNSSHAYSVPFVLLGKDQHAPLQISAFAVSANRKDVLAGYVDRSAHRWNLETNESRLVRKPQGFALPDSPSELEHAAALPDGISVLAERSGRILIYRPDAATDELTAEIAGPPLAYLAAAGARRLFAVSKSGAATIVDVSDLSRPIVTSIAALGSCRAQVAVLDHAACIGTDSSIRILRVFDSKVVLEEPPPAPAQLGYVYLSERGDLIAISDSRGDLVVKSTADGRTIVRQKLSMTLRGDLLQMAAQGPLLSEEQRAKVRSGAEELVVEIGAKLIAISPDRNLVAVSMPDSMIKIIDLRTGSTRDLVQPHSSIQELRFSEHGKLLSATEITVGGASVLSVYEVASGVRIALLSLGAQPQAKLFTLAGGRGFFTVNKGGLIVAHPLFEDPDDLVAYLAREFPEPLTPEQRRAYFID